MRLRWAAAIMDGQSIIWRWTSDRKLSVTSWFSTLNFLLSLVVFHRVASLFAVRATSLQMFKRLLATLWQICYRGSEGIGSPLANFFKGVRGYLTALWQIISEHGQTFTKSAFCQKVASTIWYVARGYWSSSRAVDRGYWIASRDICKRVAPRTKKEVTFCNTSEEPKR